MFSEINDLVHVTNTCSGEEKQQTTQIKTTTISCTTWLFWTKHRTVTVINSLYYTKQNNYIENQTIRNKTYIFLTCNIKILICMCKDLQTTEKQETCIGVWRTLIAGNSGNIESYNCRKRFWTTLMCH